MQNLPQKVLLLFAVLQTGFNVVKMLFFKFCLNKNEQAKLYL